MGIDYMIKHHCIMSTVKYQVLNKFIYIYVCFIGISPTLFGQINYFSSVFLHLYLLGFYWSSSNQLSLVLIRAVTSLLLLAWPNNLGLDSIILSLNSITPTFSQLELLHDIFITLKHLCLISRHA